MKFKRATKKHQSPKMTLIVKFNQIAMATPAIMVTSKHRTGRDKFGKKVNAKFLSRPTPITKGFKNVKSEESANRIVSKLNTKNIVSAFWYNNIGLPKDVYNKTNPDQVK